MYPMFGMGYSKESGLPLPQVISDYLALDVLVWIFAVVVLARVFLILRRRVEPSEIWDGLALGGFCYFCRLHLLAYGQFVFPRTRGPDRSVVPWTICVVVYRGSQA